jgi:hypothetical protein
VYRHKEENIMGNIFFDRVNMSLKRFMQKDLSGFFVVSIGFTGLLFFYSLIGSLLLPQGVNAYLTSILWKAFLGILALLTAVYLIWKLLTRKMAYTYTKKSEPFQIKDFIFLLIPMTPVMQYILANQDSLNIMSSSLIFAFFGMISAVFGIIIPVLLSRFFPKKILITASIGFICLIMGMASLSAMYAWSGKGQIWIQLIALAVVILIISARKFLPEKIFAAAIVIFFSVNTVSGILFKESPKEMTSTVKNLSVMSVLEGKTIKKKNDVLLIMYEAYQNYETIKHYGFDNSEQMAYLEKNGFHISHGVYSLGAPTEQSLSKMFNIDRDISEHKKYLAGGGAVHAILEKQGYKTYGVFDNSWNLRGLPYDQIKYDQSFPKPSGVMDTKVLINAILIGEFSDAVSFEGVDYNSYVNHKLRVINKEFPSPVFMYSHSSFPGHGPSGMGMRPEDAEGMIGGHFEGLKRANAEMKQDIEAAIKKNPDAIVIIAGDHGPFLTKTGYGLSKGSGGYRAKDVDRYDIQDRFGAFLAIRWPEKHYAAKYDIRIIQDVFPAVFSYLYDDDSLFNKLRIERMTKENFRTLGVYVKDGVIHGGKDDGQKLFLMEK